MSGNNQKPAGPQGLAPLNPERIPALQAKWAKYLGKDLEKIEICYTADGVTIELKGMAGTPFESLKEASVAEFKAMKAKANEPSQDEKVRNLRNKFELRLNREFPKEGGPKDGSDSAIQQFLDGLAFRERRALMMTQKQFEKSYPNGYTAA